MSTPRVSICLPTWNGERDLARLLPALAAQRVEGGLEIVAIDSSSSDRTRALLERAGARVTRIEQREFRHGATRNRIASQARGEFLVFLSQDALPEGERFVARLIDAFEDPRTAGVAARILPHPGDDPLTARTVLDAPDAGSEARVFEGAGAPAIFNDVASAVRSSVFRVLPFADVAFGEDQLWARSALAAGHRIRFVPECVVRHAHRYTARTAFARYRVDAEHQKRAFGTAVRPSAWSVARGLVHELVRDVEFVRAQRASVLALCRAPALRAGQVLGQYVGSR